MDGKISIRILKLAWIDFSANFHWIFDEQEFFGIVCQLTAFRLNEKLYLFSDIFSWHSIVCYSEIANRTKWID